MTLSIPILSMPVIQAIVVVATRRHYVDADERGSDRYASLRHHSQRSVKGAQSPSRRETVLMNHPARSIERWMHSDGRSVTIPLHGGREIGPPLFFKILRQLSVSLEEFDRLR